MRTGTTWYAAERLHEHIEYVTSKHICGTRTSLGVLTAPDLRWVPDAFVTEQLGRQRMTQECCFVCRA